MQLKFAPPFVIALVDDRAHLVAPLAAKHFRWRA